MGMYMYVNSEEIAKMKTVKDREVNEELQIALKYRPDLLIQQYEVRSKSWLSKAVTKVYFNVYHEHPGHDGKPYQARYQSSASGHKSTVIAYLHGIINGNQKIIPSDRVTGNKIFHMTEQQKTVYDYIFENCKSQFLENQRVHTAYITLGQDFQRFGTSEWEAKDTLARCLAVTDSQRVRDIILLSPIPPGKTTDAL